MKVNLIRLFFALLFTAVLSSCSSTYKTEPPTKATPVIIVPKQKPPQKEDKTLTDAEKKALKEADLWLPASSTKSSSTKK